MTCARPPSLIEKLRFLGAPDAYAQRPVQVQVKQTRMSWPFLTDTTAYKLKKPIANTYLDFRTLSARAANCRDELMLNRRLAPEVYLGLSCLWVDAQGRLGLADVKDLDRSGEVVEWLVRMHRLPSALTLEHALRHGAIDAAQISAVGAVLGAFYRALPPCGISGPEHVALFKSQHGLNEAALRQPDFALNASQLQRVLGALQHWFAHESDLMHERVLQGRVVEGQGDLRPEHVFLTDPPVIIDGLEFNRSLRLVDWVDEIAFLTLECAVLGARPVGLALRAQIEQALQDVVPERLFQFYLAFRACLRARAAGPGAFAGSRGSHARKMDAGGPYLSGVGRCCSGPLWPAGMTAM